MKRSSARETAARALHCLEDLALEKGLDSVSMRDVAARAGLSLSSLQYHFPSKAALIERFVRRTIERSETEGADLLAAAEGGPYLPAVLQYSIEETLKSAQGGLFALIEARAQHDAATAEAMEGFWRASLEGYAEVVALDHPTLSEREVLLAATLIASMIEGLAATSKAADALGLDVAAQVEAVKQAALALPARLARIG